MSDDKLSPEAEAVAIVVVVGAIMSILDTTIVNVALESLSRDLHAPLSTIQWVATGYLLALATVIPLTGWAAERFGPRRVWMTVVTGVRHHQRACAALAWSAESLIAFRVLQGLAGGMIMPIGMITLAQSAGPQRMGQVMGVIGVPMLLGPVLGPVLGGLLVDAPVLALDLLREPPDRRRSASCSRRGCCRRARRRARRRRRAGRLDWKGLRCCRPASRSSSSASARSSSHGAVTPCAPAAGRSSALALVAAFVVPRAGAPSRRWSTCACCAARGFAAAAATIFLVGGALFGALLLLPLYFQIARGQSRAAGRPAHGAPGPGRGAGHEPRRQARPTGSAAGASCSPASRC